MRALQEYGRLIKTIHIVRCLDSPEYRRAIGRQLNKGEQLHNLRRFLFFANEGEIRRSQSEDQTTQVLCLNLAANAIITWNTVYMAEALGAIQAEGIAVDHDDLAHTPPTLWSHVNVYGKYEFDVDAGSRRNGLRPLRRASAASA
jgi:TnpA family transposase